MSKISKEICQGLFSGMCIGLGALVSTIALTGNTSFGIGKLIASAAFSVGLIMSYTGSGLLYTGLCSTLCPKIASNEYKEHAFLLLKSWCLNFVGALLLALMVAPVADNVAHTFSNIGVAKTSLSLVDMYWKAFFCNILVCFAVVLSRKVKHFTDLIITIGVPVTVFVCCGFEHSVANMFYLPMAKICGAPITTLSIVKSIFMVTLGNFIGGFFMSFYAYLLGVFEEKGE